MHYTGTLASNGAKFDSSVDKGRPFQFVIGIGQVIAGWDEGVMQMSLGEKANLKIPSSMVCFHQRLIEFAIELMHFFCGDILQGYGAEGAGGVIPPNADLIFEVELLCINHHQSKNFQGASGSCSIL
jgi:FK506-binding protein 1